MERTPVYAAETGVLTGMLGGDVVKEAEVEVIRWFTWDEIEADIFEFALW